jgi:hypothetical protein
MNHGDNPCIKSLELAPNVKAGKSKRWKILLLDQVEVVKTPKSVWHEEEIMPSLFSHTALH